MLNSIISENWTKILIQGRNNSGKSEFTLWVLKQLIKEKSLPLNYLLDNKENVLLLTEKVDQVSLIEHNLFNRINIVENISSKDAFHILKTYHENFDIDYLVIDYINLLTYQTHVMRPILEYLKEHGIKAIFIESTHKFLKENLSVNQEADCIIQTSRGTHGIEVVIKKQNGIGTNKVFWIDAPKGR